MRRSGVSARSPENAPCTRVMASSGFIAKRCEARASTFGWPMSCVVRTCRPMFSAERVSGSMSVVAPTPVRAAISATPLPTLRHPTIAIRFSDNACRSSGLRAKMVFAIVNSKNFSFQICFRKHNRKNFEIGARRALNDAYDEFRGMDNVLRTANHLPCRLAIRPRQVGTPARMDMQFSEPLQRRIVFEQPGVLPFRMVVVAAVVAGRLQSVLAGSYDMPDYIPVLADIAEDPHAGFDVDLVHDLVDAFKDPAGEYKPTHCLFPCTR